MLEQEPVTIFLRRHETSDEGTFGTLIVGDVHLATGELPWRDNKNKLSCIPTGTYKCIWNYSQKFNRFMYEVLDVSGRTGIRFHAANFCGDESLKLKCEINGCIALGEKHGVLDGQKALIYSQQAVRRFEQIMQMQTFILEVTDDY